AMRSGGPGKWDWSPRSLPNRAEPSSGSPYPVACPAPHRSISSAAHNFTLILQRPDMLLNLNIFPLETTAPTACILDKSAARRFEITGTPGPPPAFSRYSQLTSHALAHPMH